MKDEDQLIERGAQEVAAVVIAGVQVAKELRERKADKKSKS